MNEPTEPTKSRPRGEMIDFFKPSPPQRERNEMDDWVDLCLTHLAEDELNRILNSTTWKTKPDDDDIMTALGKSMRELNIMPRALAKEGLLQPWASPPADGNNVVSFRRNGE
jgi:hypothetical protein